MDTVTDLASRAVSFITLIQEALLKIAVTQHIKVEDLNITVIQPAEFIKKVSDYFKQDKDYSTAFKKRAMELVWISDNQPGAAKTEKIIAYTLQLSEALMQWIHKNKGRRAIQEFKSHEGFPAPFTWRDAISRILYLHTEQRTALAGALQYLPIQIVLALGGGNSRYEVKDQRIFQLWQMPVEDMKTFLTAQETDAYHAFMQAVTQEDAERLLVDDDALAQRLTKVQAPLPFELVFRAELHEISENRRMRSRERRLIKQVQPGPEEQEKSEILTKAYDPFGQAADMKLRALAFSGGGVRSATFNLGILQGLAKKELIGKFDYMSTVSGGGYIGSWLAAWISREGSVTGVSDHLNPEKSPDPFGEEVMPIRWLRMFSNYFAPKSSIMSADSWTIGVTWLRNTLLNQLIILLLFISVLLSGQILYLFWAGNYIVWTAKTSIVLIYACSALLLLPASLLAGLGMRIYYSSKSRPFIPFKKRTGKAGKIAKTLESLRAYLFTREKTGKVSSTIIALGFVAAYLVSTWLFSRAASAPNLRFTDKLAPLQPAAIVCFFALAIVALLGGYNKYIEALHEHQPPKWINDIVALFDKRSNSKEKSPNSRIPKPVLKIYAWVIILFTAAIAAWVALYCMAAGWQLIQLISNTTSPDPHFNKKFYEGVAFTFGVPIVLEVFSITVVARMATLGRYFPDERREWWGKMGAIVHSFAFLWILFSGSALLVNGIASYLVNKWWAGAATLGGWVALVGSAVKAAFSAKTSGKEEPKGALPVVLDVLGKAGPYLFFLGLLVFIPRLIVPIEGYANNHLHTSGSLLVQLIVLTVMLGAITYMLARQVGVNEFSMHHFYRNRLVRAYLGATRRGTERQKTANPFTGFDAEDDEKLYKFTHKKGYYGPYPVLNTALNASQVTTLDRQDRQAESFIFSPLYCGFDFSKARASADTKIKSYDYGYRKTEQYAYEEGPGIGTAMAISGAAVNPNQGYHSSPATAFLLTVFNVRMGWWMGNPRKSAWNRSDPGNGLGYLIGNLAGQTNTRKKFVCLSDGGHFDNMGLYEMIRRRCSFILLGDGEQDDRFTCEGLANAIRRCRIDFGAEITIDVRQITNRDEKKFSKKHYAIGTIRYAGEKNPSGALLYIKSSITGEEPVDVHEYSLKNPSFPHQTTADQFFDEEQFESYRKLGLYIADQVLEDLEVKGLLGA